MKNTVIEALLISAQKSLKDLGGLINKKKREADARWEKEQKEKTKQIEMRRATQIKADLTQDIKTILKNNIYFQDVETIAISECDYNVQTGFWEITIETLLKTMHDLERPRIIATLNDSKSVYFRQLELKRENDWIEFAKAENSPTAEQIKMDLMRYQLQQRYQLLEHMLYFVAIKCEKDGEYTNVKIFVKFR